MESLSLPRSMSGSQPCARWSARPRRVGMIGRRRRTELHGYDVLHDILLESLVGRPRVELGTFPLTGKGTPP
jgi:hypothetical protein